MRQTQPGNFTSSSKRFRSVISKQESPQSSTSGRPRSISPSSADLSWCACTCRSMRSITCFGANFAWIVCTDRTSPLFPAQPTAHRSELDDWQPWCDLNSSSAAVSFGGCLSRRIRRSRTAASDSVAVLLMRGLAAPMEVCTFRGWYSRLVRLSLRPSRRRSCASCSIRLKNSSPPMGRPTSLLSSPSLPSPPSLKMLELEAGSSVEQAGPSEEAPLQRRQSLPCLRASREGRSARVGKKDLAESIDYNSGTTELAINGYFSQSSSPGLLAAGRDGRGGMAVRILAGRDNNMNNLMGLESREEVQRALEDCHEHEDLFGEYIRQVILRAPLGYIFINIILVIWIAQTIFSSHLNAIPNSMYLLSPLLAAAPLQRLALLPARQQCPPGLQPLALKTLPTIYADHINHQQIYGWDADPVQFCAKEIAKEKKSLECAPGELLCSGYCVDTPGDCPITKLKVAPKDTPLEADYEEIYQSPEGKSFRISRMDGNPFVAIKVAYETKCASDEHYNEAFENEADFWKKSSDCGKEGSISEFFNPVDKMETNTFFAANEIGITTTNSSMQEVTLGTVPEFHLSSDSSKGCEVASEQTESVKKYFVGAAPAPQFSGILTGFSFVLLIANLLWLLGYYYIPQWLSTMNIITLGLSIIEQVIVGFIYSNNVELFRLEKVTQTLRNCLEEQVPALKEWEFGMESPQAFQMLLFVNTAYLGLHISALLYNHFCLQAYKRRPVLLPLPSHHPLSL